MSGLGATSIGGQVELEDMESSSLGDHDRGRQAVFLEHRLLPFWPADRGYGRFRGFTIPPGAGSTGRART